jgi:hypothetical protein
VAGGLGGLARARPFVARRVRAGSGPGESGRQRRSGPSGHVGPGAAVGAGVEAVAAGGAGRAAGPAVRGPSPGGVFPAHRAASGRR